MSKVTNTPADKKFSPRKEYVFLSESGKFYVFRFRSKNGKKLVLTRKEDALAVNDIDYLFKMPVVGDFTWNFDMIFGKKGLSWECLGEL
jgi:hypothetical protein